MTGRLTVRSPLAILTSLTNTAVVALIVAGFWYYVWSRATGADWLLVYALPAIAILLLLLPFRLRLTIAPKGIVVTNLVVRDTTPWPDVADVSVGRLHTNLLLRVDFSAPGIEVVKKSGVPVVAYATWGLREATRRELAAALDAAAEEHGFRNRVTAEALKFRGRPADPSP